MGHYTLPHLVNTQEFINAGYALGWKMTPAQKAAHNTEEHPLVDDLTPDQLVEVLSANEEDLYAAIVEQLQAGDRIDTAFEQGRTPYLEPLADLGQLDTINDRMAVLTITVDQARANLADYAERRARITLAVTAILARGGNLDPTRLPYLHEVQSYLDDREHFSGALAAQLAADIDHCQTLDSQYGDRVYAVEDSEWNDWQAVVVNAAGLLTHILETGQDAEYVILTGGAGSFHA